MQPFWNEFDADSAWEMFDEDKDGYVSYQEFYDGLYPAFVT